MMRGTLKRLACSLCQSYAAVKQYSPFSLSAVRSNRLYVGGISPFMRREALRKAFEPFGEVEEALVLRGFGFVTMPNDAEAEEAIKSLDGKRVFDAERVTVQLSKPHQNRGPNIVVDNLPLDASESELKEALSQFGKVLRLTPREGFAFALLDSPDSADRAVQSIAQTCRLGPFSSVRARIFKVKIDKLFVGNLTEDVSVSMLKESFERFGQVDDVSIFTNFALVTMSSPEAAMEAMRALHGTRMGQATDILVAPSRPMRRRPQFESRRQFGGAHTSGFFGGTQRRPSAAPAGVGRHHGWRDRSDQWDNRHSTNGLTHPRTASPSSAHRGAPAAASSEHAAAGGGTSALHESEHN